MQSSRPWRIALIGVGALGTEVTLRLAQDPLLSASLAVVLLIDPDHLQAHNIGNSRLFTAQFRRHGSALLGEPKVLVAARHLHSTTTLRCSPILDELADLSWCVLQDLDALVSCTDNALARAELAHTARALGLPVLDAAVMGETEQGSAPADGRVSWFPPATGAACYLCGLGAQRRADLLAYAASPSLGCQPLGEIALGDDPQISPVLQHTADHLVQQLHRHLRHDDLSATGERNDPLVSSATRLHLVNDLWTEDRLVLRRSPSCPWHEAPLPLVAVEPDQTFGSVIEACQAVASTPTPLRLQLPWPISLLARCRQCGTSPSQPRRLARLRRRYHCPVCGAAHQLEPLRVLASVGDNEPVAHSTPRQLGWTDRQLFQLRPAMAPVLSRKELP